MLFDDPRYKGVCNHKMVQFFRHVRNAASHGNKFNIEKKNIDQGTGGLIKPAEWREASITPKLNGQELIPGFMEMADPIWLISDVSILIK